MQKRIATVIQINAYIKSVLERDLILQNIWIRGEISNFKLHYSGHMYLNLKDEGSVIRAIMFKGANQKMLFKPENGMMVLARGRISAYERDGQYQLYIEEMQPDGIGDLYIAFEQLKAKLEKEGLFETSRKKPIPKYPSKIGVVTSSTGAAVRDIITVLKRRYKTADVLIYPVLVQGLEAAGQIKTAIEYFNKHNAADVLIVGRGGGSIEDLWAFNEEIVARAVYNSEIPVISAVGHETDFTICDFASDLRAPTPSAAAEIAVPHTDDLSIYLNTLKAKMESRLISNMRLKRENLQSKAKSSAFTRFKDRFDDAKFLIDHNLSAMEKAIRKQLTANNEEIKRNAASLDALSPLKVLKRGYAVALDESGVAIKDAENVNIGDRINILVEKGRINCDVVSVGGENND